MTDEKEWDDGRTELDRILTKIECGLASGDRAFYVMARDRLTEYIKTNKETTCEHPNVRFDVPSDYQKVRRLDMASDEVTHIYICPDCEGEVEGETEGGV